jgi:hypothetical protein
MASGNKEKIIGIGIVVLIVIAVAVLFESGAFRSSANAANKLPDSYVPSCATYNNCTSSPCPSGSYLNNSLGYCYWNYTAGEPCPAGAVYQNNQNCQAEAPTLNVSGSSYCVAGYTYDKQNGFCEPLSGFCKSGYAFYAKGMLSSDPVCALANACGSGYNLTFNESINNFLCMR